MWRECENILWPGFPSMSSNPFMDWETLKKPWLLWRLDALSLPTTLGCCMLQVRAVPALICPRLSVLLNTLTTIVWAARLGSTRVVHLEMYLTNSHDRIKEYHENADCPPDVSSPIASITFLPMSVCCICICDRITAGSLSSDPSNWLRLKLHVRQSYSRSCLNQPKSCLVKGTQCSHSSGQKGCGCHLMVRLFEVVEFWESQEQVTLFGDY